MCRFCDNDAATADLLKDMQTANVPLIPTNDTINNIVDVVGRPNAKWNKDIAAEVIKVYDTIAPWRDRIDEIVGHCLNTCNSIEEIERGQNPCNHIFYNWSVLISVYEDHAIAYRDVTQPERATAEAATPATSPQPDFSHMNSYKPTIEFDMGALYSFLIGESVITGIDEKLFGDYITHAHINELWECAGQYRKRNLLQCLIKALSNKYERGWLSHCAENLNKTEKQISNPTTSGATQDFEDKLRRVLQQK